MPEAEDERGETPGRRRRRRSAGWVRRVGIALALLGVVLAGLWVARKPLASRYADRFLADRGVPARYRIADLGLGRQRLVDVVIGDPAHPDLVADWLETTTTVGRNGPHLTGVRGGRVRVRGAWRDGKLTLGNIDRLIPPGQGGRFTLPALSLDVADLRARIETPLGLVGAKLVGSGRLDGGFAGKVALVSSRLGDACGATRPRAVATVRTFAAGIGRPAPIIRLQGSGESRAPACAGVTAAFANASGSVDLILADTPRWTVAADLAGTAVRSPVASAQATTAQVRLAGDARRFGGAIATVARGVAADGVAAGAVRLNGRVARDPARPFAFDGRAFWSGARVTRLALPVGVGEGTPVGPLLRRAAVATRAALDRFDGGAGIAVATGPGGANVTVRQASATSASGARAMFDAAGEGGGARWTRASGLTVAGVAQVAGGGLPEGAIRFDAEGRTVTGVARLAPYAADGAALALAPVRFAYTPAGGTAATIATLTGPLAGGRVEALTLPVDARWKAGRLEIGRGCVPVTWRLVAVSGLRVDPAALRLCPTGGALVAVAGGRMSGGAALGATRLTGRLGASPLTLAAAGGRLSLGERGFRLDRVAALIGAPGRQTRIEAATLDGGARGGGVGGRFAGAGGRIGAVPLVMSAAAGGWRFANGRLALDGALTVADAQVASPRFNPMPVDGVAMTLAGNRIDARGTVRAPVGTREVAAVTLWHRLDQGIGQANFTVPGLTFDQTLQPDQLTPITKPIIADVRGTLTGAGRIDWSPAGVTSTGRFTTAGTDLAAAVGPVEGIAGTIEFTDLLALESAPGQVFTVRSINPGIAVTDGTVRLQTLADSRVRVEGARWPFAGGTLTLDPTLLDFGTAAERRMTFRLDGVAADRFLQQFEFDNLNATGTFDGVLPMVFDASGGRIAGGRLAVRAGGGTLAYVGPVSQKNVGFWGNLAFQALKSLRYRNLTIAMDGPLAGEMVTEVRFAGVSQGEGAQRGGIVGLVVGRLQRLPLLFNIRIRAPFRGLIDSTASFYDPSRLVARNLPALIEEQNRRAGRPAPAPTPTPTPQPTPRLPAPVQPPATRLVP